MGGQKIFKDVHTQRKIFETDTLIRTRPVEGHAEASLTVGHVNKFGLARLCFFPVKQRHVTVWPLCDWMTRSCDLPNRKTMLKAKNK